MLNFRYCLIALVMTCLGGSLASAETQALDPKQLMWGTDHNKSRFKSKPARELMTMSEYETYRRALKALDYESAGRLLNRSFIRQYPQFRRARLVPDCLKSRDCRYWLIYANSSFLEYGICRALLGLGRAENDLRQHGIIPPKFALQPWPLETKYANQFVRRRDEALALLISQAALSYLPAITKLAELIRRGDVFNAGDEAEYYILKRGCVTNGDCAVLAHRLAELREKITPERASVIEGKARARASDRPRLQRLLLSGKL